MNLKINGQSIKIPSRWEDITFNQYIEFINLKENDAFAVVALFTGIDREVWEKSTYVENFYLVERSLSWMNKEPNFKNVQLPYEVIINDKPIRVPQDDSEYIVKEYEDLRAVIQLEMKDGKEPGIDLYPKIAAIFLTRRIFPEYNTANYDKTITLVKNLTLFEVMGIGSFFLKNLSVLRTGINPGWHMRSTMWRKLTLAFVRLKYGVFSIR